MLSPTNAPTAAQAMTAISGWWWPAAATPPMITQVSLGKGMVIRIGLPGWAAKLGHDPDVDQLTRNAVDLLAGGKPKPRSLTR